MILKSPTRTATGTARLWAVPAVLLLMLSTAQPVHAQAGKRPDGSGSLGSVIDETTNTVLRIFGAFLKAIPQFEAPEVLPNGDIIIRRKQPGSSPESEDDEAEDGDTRQI